MTSSHSRSTTNSGTSRPPFKGNKPSGTRQVHQVNLRARVVRVLVDVMAGQSLNELLAGALNHVETRDKGLFHELVLGTLRHWFALNAQIQPMLSNPVTDTRVQASLMLGLYQLLNTRVPPHAAISETVDACKQIGMDKASGLVNALLRRSLREIETIQPAFIAHHGLPEWLAKQLASDWANEWVEIAQQLKQMAPLTLRINARKTTREEYLALLAEEEIEASLCEYSADGIRLHDLTNVTELPFFEEGWFAVQDEHAQLCASLLGDVNEKTVLDACSAPGGKTAHLLEKFAPKHLIALDIDENRLERVVDNLSRLQLWNEDDSQNQQIELLASDACEFDAIEAFGRPVDAILLDAPCTAIGVMRRHPDIRLLRQANDVKKTVQLQAKMLDHIWTQLAQGGTLLYCTCSLLKAENELQMNAFLARTQDAREVKIDAEWGQERRIGRQCFPSLERGDGFYFAKLTKI